MSISQCSNCKLPEGSYTLRVDLGELLGGLKHPPLTKSSCEASRSCTIVFYTRIAIGNERWKGHRRGIAKNC